MRTWMWSQQSSVSEIVKDQKTEKGVREGRGFQIWRLGIRDTADLIQQMLDNGAFSVSGSGQDIEENSDLFDEIERFEDDLEDEEDEEEGDREDEMTE